jgi:hypothetical protein
MRATPPIDKIIQNLNELIHPSVQAAWIEVKNKGVCKPGVALMRWFETRAITACLEKLGLLKKSFDEELSAIPSNAATPTNSKDKEEDDGNESNEINLKNAFLKDLLIREHHEQLSNKTQKLQARFEKYKALCQDLNPVPLQKNDEAIRAACEKVLASRKALNNSAAGETLVADAELKKKRDPALENMRATLLSLKKIGQKGYQRNFILKTILPALRERMWRVSTAKNEAEIAEHVYAFYYTDLAPLKIDIEKKSAEWKGWGGKTHEALDQFEEKLKELSQNDNNIAEVFYKETFEKMVINIKETIRKFALEKNPRFCFRLASEHASRNGGATGELYEPSVDRTANNILSDLEAIIKAKKTYQQKITDCYRSTLVLKKNILMVHSDKYMAHTNDHLIMQDRLENRLSPQKKLAQDKSEQNKFEQNKIHSINKMQKTFEENFQPAFLSQNMKLANKIARTVDKGASKTAPNAIREIAQPIYRTLLTIDDRCVSYFKKRANSHWFGAIDEAKQATLTFGYSPLSPIELLLKTYDAFLTAKIKMLDETLDPEAEGRSKLFNSRSLALVNEVIKLAGNEVSRLSHANQLKPDGENDYTDLLNQIHEKSNNTITKTKAVEKKYSSFFFGIKKPEIDLKISLLSIGKNNTMV